MYAIQSTGHLPKPQIYQELYSQLTGVFSNERNALANSANFAAILFATLPDLNWAGFYFVRQGELVLGPFQGKVACVRIPLGEGVCGTAAATRQTQIVKDVHAFPGHIACDGASNSEIVLPLVTEKRLLGVLDLDSPTLDRFDAQDAAGLSPLVALLLESSDMDEYF